LLVLAAGVAGFVGLKKLKKPPEKHEQTKREQLVRVMDVTPRNIRLTVRAEGTADYKRRVELRTQVGGKIVNMSPNLEEGKRVAKGEILVLIEQTDYALAVRRAEAEVSAHEASLARLEQDEKNSRRLIETLRDDLELAQAEVARAQRLLADSAGSQAEVDNARRTFLRQKNALEIAENNLALLPARTEEQRAMMRAADVHVEEARLAFARTEIRSPFDAVVAGENVEVGKVLQVNQSVAVLGDDSVMAVTAMLGLSELAALCLPDKGFSRNPGCAGTPATVVWNGMGVRREWHGEVSRLGMVDPSTRTVPIVVDVKSSGNVAGRLPSGAYCRVEIPGRQIENVLVVPRNALRDGNRLFLERSGTLEIAGIHVAHAQGDNLVVDRGLSPGDRVILSEVLFPVPGMRVRPVQENAASARPLKEGVPPSGAGSGEPREAGS